METTDQLGRKFVLPQVPQRIVSVVPSQTELLFDLGLAGQVVGVTWFCERPAEQVKEKAKVGGTKNLKLEKILELEPDLIIANKEENEREQIEELAQQVPVWVSDVDDLPSALEMMRSVGHITGREEAAAELAQQVAERFQRLQPLQKPLKTVYFIWRKPWMTIGADTFIHQVLHRCGLSNLFSNQIRYPEVDLQALKEQEPELLLLSSEPYPFKQPHLEELQAEFPQAQILLVDGQLFSWYGSRLLEAPEYLQEVIQKVDPGDYRVSIDE